MPLLPFDKYKWDICTVYNWETTLITYDPLFPMHILYTQTSFRMTPTGIMKRETFTLTHSSTIDHYENDKKFNPRSYSPAYVEIGENINVRKMFETIQQISNSCELTPD